jgi:hypothetical protein
VLIAGACGAVACGGDADDTVAQTADKREAGADAAIATVPAWRQGLAKWQWVELPGTSLSNQPVPNPSTGDLETPSQRIDAWNGLAANRDNNRVYLACAGGHADWAGNEAYEIDLQLDQPRWRLLRNPTAGKDVLFGQSYYADGRPSSTHLYYALQFVRARGRVFKLSAGSLWGSGNESNSKVDAFDLVVSDWDPAGTYAEGVPGGGAIDRPYAQDQTTDDAYTFFGGAFRRWSAATATWESLAPRPSYANDDIVSGSGSAVDPTRQAVFVRNAYRTATREGLALTFGASPTLTDVTFTGPASSTVTTSATGVQYLPGEDAFLLKTGTGGEVARIDAATLVVTSLTTSGPTPPDAVNGVYTRWLYLPRLKGLAYLPHGKANFWFLASE